MEELETKPKGTQSGVVTICSQKKKLKDKEILDGINYRYHIKTGKKWKVIHTKDEPNGYCQRCGKKCLLFSTLGYWFNTGTFDFLCDDCVNHYKDVEKKNNPMMAKYVER